MLPPVRGGAGLPDRRARGVETHRGRDRSRLHRRRRAGAASTPAICGGPRHGVAVLEGTVGGKPVVLTPAEDLRVDVGEEATGRRFGGEGFAVVMISVRSDTIVLNFTHLAAEGRTDRLPDPLTTTRTGVQKLVG
jgi:hypothetical protein